MSDQIVRLYTNVPQESVEEARAKNSGLISAVLREMVRQRIIHPKDDYTSIPDLSPIARCTHLGIPSEQMAKKLYNNAEEGGTLTWAHILVEEVSEVVCADGNSNRLEELIQLAAVCMTWAKCLIDREGEIGQPVFLCKKCGVNSNPDTASGCDSSEDPMCNWYCHSKTVDSDQTSSSVDHPKHYGGGDNQYEAIKVIEAMGVGEGFTIGNAIKYIMRAGKKDKSKEVEDLKKAMWYINRRIEQLTNDKV